MGNSALQLVWATCSAIKLANHQLLSLMLEPLPAHTVVLTMNSEGGIQHCSSSELGDLCGRTLASLCVTPGVDPVGMSLAARTSVRAAASGTLHGGPVDLRLRLLDREALCVVHVAEMRGPRCLTVVREKVQRLGKRDSFTSLAQTNHMGHYSVTGKVLGTGQCGQVMQGVHRPTGTLVAIKALKPQVLNDIVMTWPEREVQLMKHLSHPNVIKLYDVLVVPEEAQYLVMELASGGDLLERCLHTGVRGLCQFAKHNLSLL
jgi:hypothetical protein